MVLVPVEEIVVVSIVFHLFFDSVLLFFSFVPHPFTPRLSVLPVLIGLLILEVSSGGITEYKLVISGPLIWVAQNRVSLSYFFEEILNSQQDEHTFDLLRSSSLTASG